MVRELKWLKGIAALILVNRDLIKIVKSTLTFIKLSAYHD